MASAFATLRRKLKKYRHEFRRYSLLIIIPMVLGIVLFLCVRSITYKQLDESGSAAVDRFRAESYGVLHELQIVSESILSDMGLQDYVAGQRPEDPLRVCESLREHLLSSPYISDVYLICQKQDSIYSSHALFSYDGLELILRDITGSDVANLRDAPMGWHVLNANYAAPYYLSVFPGGDAFLLVTLDKTSFVRTLYDNDAALCCVYNEQFCISSALTNYNDTDWSSESAVSALLGEKVKCFYTEQDGYTYMTALSMRSYREPLKMIVTVFGIYFAVSIIFCVIYLHWTSKKRYDDAASMLDGLPNKVSADSPYEDILEAVRTSLEAYKRHYDDQLRFKKRNLVSSFLSNSREMSAPEMLQQLGLEEDTPCYVGLVHFSGTPGVLVDVPTPNNIDVTCTVLYSALKKSAGDGLGVLVSHLDHNYIIILSIQASEVSDKDIRRIFDETVCAIESEYLCRIMALVSRRTEDPSQLSRAHKEAVSLYEFVHSAHSDVTVLLYSDMETNAGALLNGSFNKQLQLISTALHMEKYDIAPSLVASILEEHVMNLGVHFPLAQSRISAVANALIEAVAAGKLPREQREFYIQQLQGADSIDVLNNLTAEICAEFRANGSEETGTDVVDKACEYILGNLSRPDLSVPDVGEAVGVSVQHLLRLFRRRYNMTVVEYINSTRIERAKQLILTEGMTVNRVVEAVGYGNNVTFSRNFKRYVGMSPSDYRDINK